MKITKSFSASCLLLLASVCHAQPGEFIALEKVPQPVQQKFKLIYPEENIARAQWEYEHGGYEAYLKNEKGQETGVAFFSAEGKLEYRIFIGENGFRTGTEREINSDELPETLRNSLSEQYKGKTLSVALTLLDAAEQTTLQYRVLIANNQLLYDSSGKLLQTKKIDSETK